jgi:hypothetical protein
MPAYCESEQERDALRRSRSRRRAPRGPADGVERFLSRRGDHGSAARQVTAPDVEREPEIRQRKGLGSADESPGVCQLLPQTLRVRRREREQVHRPVRLHRRRRCRRRFLHDDVCVRPTDAERIEPGASRQRHYAPTLLQHRLRPLGQRPLHVEGHLAERNLRAELRRCDRRHPLPVGELQENLDQAHHAGAGLEMADVRLDRPDRAGRRQVQPAVVERGIAVGQRQPSHFDGVAEQRAGSVGLDIRDRPRIDARGLQTAADRLGLGLRIGGGEPDRAAAGAETGPLDHSVDAIAAAKRLGQWAQHDHAGAFAKHRAVGVGAEGLAGATGREDAETAERRKPIGIENQVDAAGNRHLTLAGFERVAREMDGGAGRGAGGIHRQTGTVEAEQLR